MIPILPFEQKQALSNNVKSGCDWINNELSELQPAELLFVFIMILLISKFLLATFAFIKEEFRPSKIKVTLFRLAKKWIPMVKKEIEKESKKM